MSEPETSLVYIVSSRSGRKQMNKKQDWQDKLIQTWDHNPRMSQDAFCCEILFADFNLKLVASLPLIKLKLTSGLDLCSSVVECLPSK